MAITGSLTISGSKLGLPSGSETIGPLTITNNVTGDACTAVNLANGDNTITVPVGGTYVGCVIVPPSANNTALKLKGGGADAGITIHPSNPMYLGLAAAQTTFIINAGGAVNGVVIQWI